MTDRVMTLVDLTVPGDKSITHRALILASLGDGESRLSGLLDSADTRATAAALRELGVGAPVAPFGEARIHGRGLRGWTPPARPLDCGNSGTTARLLLGALAGCRLQATLDGDASLRSRPMRRVTRPVADMGAAVENLGEPDRLPVRIHGHRPLRPLHHASPRASAQVKSALLLAGLTGAARVHVSEPWLSRDHTERLLLAMDAPLTRHPEGERPAVTLEPADRLEPIDLSIPGDLSSAAFFLGLAALGGTVRVRNVGLNPTRAGVLDVLRRMGGRVDVQVLEERSGEPVGDVSLAGQGVRGVVVEAAEVPSLLDEIPLLAVLAATGEGDSRFEGIAELRVKEADRVAAIRDNLRGLGVETDDGPDHLLVRGRPGPFIGTVRSFGDHRIAMAFGVLAARPGNRIRVDGTDAVAVSYPRFWDDLERVRTGMRPA